MYSVHDPEGYTLLIEAFKRYVIARREGGLPCDGYREFFNEKQALVEWCIEFFNEPQSLPPPPYPVSLDEERRIRVKVERWVMEAEREFVEPFRKGELVAIYRLPGSDENKVVQPQFWNNLVWPSRPFRRSMAFPDDPWFKFDGRTLFVKETAFIQWLSGYSPAVKQKQQGEASTEKESDGSGHVDFKSHPANRSRELRDSIKDVLRILPPDQRPQKIEALCAVVNERLPKGRQAKRDTLRRALKELDAEARKTF